MTQVQINESGDLEIIFKEYDNTDTPVVCKLSNDSEVEFINDECVAIVLPSFEQKLNRGPLNRDDVSIQDYWFADDIAFFNVNVGLQTVNIKLNLSSLKSKF